MADMTTSSAESLNEALSNADDCWNHIGVRGNRSCPELTQYSHCRNCPTYSGAARRLLDRPLPTTDAQDWTQHYALVPQAPEAELRSVTLFRAGAEKFAIATRRCVEAVNMRPIHRLPHRGEGVLGLANIHGELVLCLSFAALLSPKKAEGPQPAELGKLLVTDWRDGPIALAVDEALGVRKFPASHFKALPASLIHIKGRCSSALLSVDGTSVGVLDDELLEQAIKRQLA
jgi:chemotaxis-related protein WspD